MLDNRLLLPYSSRGRCMAASRWSVMGLLAILTGCAGLAGPDYERPGSPEKGAWSSRTGLKVSASETINREWWQRFGDQELDRLVGRAIDQSIDLKVLAARIGVAEAAVGQVRAASLPSLKAGGVVGIERSTGTGTSEQYNLASEVGWELDIWGKVRKGVEAQQAEVQASAADWRAGYLSLVSDVSTTYFQILQLDEQTAQQRKSLDYAARTLGIFEDMHREGMVAQTRLLQQRAEINQLRRDLLELQRMRSLSENALATLLGVPAGDLKIPEGHLSQQVRIVSVPAGLPSDLLSRRPDIVAAEYRVLQAHNLSGQARLARLPSFSLTGRLGTSSFKLSDLLKSFTAGFLPSLNIPVLDPAVNARIRVSKAQAKVAREAYRRVVISAFEDVENALVNLDSRKQQRNEISAQLDKLRAVSAQVREQLREGMVSQLEVFESERSLLAAELALLENKQQILSDTVHLYKALGGGWTHETVGLANAPTLSP